jgi:hypothetical protein
MRYKLVVLASKIEMEPTGKLFTANFKLCQPAQLHKTRYFSHSPSRPSHSPSRPSHSQILDLTLPIAEQREHVFNLQVRDSEIVKPV